MEKMSAMYSLTQACSGGADGGAGTLVGDSGNAYSLCEGGCGQAYRQERTF